MPSSPPNNGRISSNKIIWWILGALMVVTMTFGRSLMKNIRYEINTTTAATLKNTTINAKQDAEIMGVRNQLQRIETNQSKMSDKLDSILVRTSR